GSNLAGWNSSYTGLPIPPEEMEEWIHHSVEQILKFHPENVLEIGCGTGLLLLRIAPHCRYYHGSDFSKTALNYLQHQVQRNELTGRVVLAQRNADDFSEIKEQTFDLLILNSVVQYFPSVDYLVDVLSSAMRIMTSPGRIFIGDVRSLPLVRAFYASVELHQTAPALSIEQLQLRLQKRADQEKELLLDPGFFYALQQKFPAITSIEIQPKRGRYNNELTCFRYDVVLHLDSGEEPAKNLSWLDWRHHHYSVDAIRQILLEQEPAFLAFSHVANKRLLAENQTLALLNDSSLGTVGNLRYRLQSTPKEIVETALEPEDLWALGADLPYLVEISLASAREDGSYEVVFRRQETRDATTHGSVAWLTQETIALLPWETYTNIPLRDRLTRHALAELRSYVQTKLPAYMHPSGYVFLETLPLTSNGKVNYDALPLAGGALRNESKAPYVSPQTEMERILVEIWREVLQVDGIGIHDNFFEMGGHSLLMVQIYSRLCETVWKEITMVDLFKYPTVNALAQYLSQEKKEAASLPESQERAVTRKEALKRQQQNRQRNWAILPVK
ncbi:MAG TPA: phosphopantetheine-binding protein, partial [Ktedonobacteraceae bacterium]|nr:phosphopantetheine-binding protein [Ktedonobacteraceae bacterium]